MTRVKSSVLKLTAKVEELAEKILQEVEGSLLESANNEDLENEAAKHIESTKSYGTRDFDEAIVYLAQKMGSIVDSTGIINKRQFKINELSRRIITKVKDLRAEKNRQINRVDTNLLTHSPFFIGGKRKQVEEGNKVLIDKNGLKQLTYENHKGKFLSMFDAKTLFALFGIWEDQGKKEWFSFNEYELLQRMNLDRGGGKQYKMVRDSLETLRSTEVVLKEYYEKAKGRTIITKSFYLVTARNLIENEQEDGKIRSREYQFQFSPYILQSLNEGYYSLVSLAILDELKLDSSKGLYITLSALKGMTPEEQSKFYHGDSFYEIPLETLYHHLHLTDIERKNKATIKKACEDLKSLEIISDYKLAGEGRKADSIRLYPSKWFNDLMSGNLKQITTKSS